MYDVIILYYRNRCYCLSSFDSNFLYYSLSPLSADWQIYTDWANHYLEKVKSKRRIQDLPNDVTDGVILADVIEAVGKFILSNSYLKMFITKTHHQSRL